jgi:hypothetical protein
MEVPGNAKEKQFRWSFYRRRMQWTLKMGHQL